MLSNSCRYGIRAVIYLASQPSASVRTGIKQISDDLDLPTPFLAKILQELAKQKILLSSKGPHGGFSLYKDPRKIKLIDIVRAIDGEEFFTNCVMHNGTCGGRKRSKKVCSLHDDYDKIRKDLADLFGKRTIYDLVVRSGNSLLISI
ncbi:MAG TPA: Rrf2 family transcriptional regulator [Bacteroidales bacterium]|nr:Rrf2 family transcriptional regulator [Bacteroidales bacterium]